MPKLRKSGVHIKRILLVEPYGNMHWVPLSAAFLMSNFSCGDVEADFIDCSKLNLSAESKEFKNTIKRYNPDVVGVSALTSTHKEALKVLKTVKEINTNIITVMGGVHVTVYPHSTVNQEFVDYVFRGESEHTFPLFVKSLNENADISCIPGLAYKGRDNGINREIDLDKTKFPDYSIILRKGWLDEGEIKYGIKAPLWFTRGCPYQCKFCSGPVIHGKKVRKHSIKYGINNISLLYNRHGVRHFSFIDDNITMDQKYMKDLTIKIIEWKRENNIKDIVFDFANGVRMQFLDDELLMLLKRAGWDEIFIAPESGSKRTLERMKKLLNIDIVPEITERIKKAGLRVGAGFIIGYPGETIEDIQDTQRLIRKCKLDTILIQQFCPLPGTPVFDELVENGEINSEDLPSTFYLGYLGGKSIETGYVTSGLANFNFKKFFFIETFLFALRNPRFILDTLKSGLFIRFLRHVFYFSKRR